MASDARLVALIRAGHPAAFEALYERYHRPMLSFCRHVLGDQAEAEDVVQHTFLAAWGDLMRSDKAIQVRPWLFTVARNRSLSILRTRREHPGEAIEEGAEGDGLAAIVQRREDLRDLVADLRRLPDDQRSALVLAEIDALSHAEIAEVLDVPRPKVKALVFQARESLLATRTARETDCAEIRRQLATERGAALRRGNLRRHLRDCSGCREYRAQVQRQRRQFAVLLPVASSLALKDGVIGAALGGGGAAVAGGAGLFASSALKSGLVKAVAGLVLAGLGAAGTVAITHDDVSGHGRALPGSGPFAPWHLTAAVDLPVSGPQSAAGPLSAASARPLSPDTALALARMMGLSLRSATGTSVNFGPVTGPGALAPVIQPLAGGGALALLGPAGAIAQPRSQLRPGWLVAPAPLNIPSPPPVSITSPPPIASPPLAATSPVAVSLVSPGTTAALVSGAGGAGRGTPGRVTPPPASAGVSTRPASSPGTSTGRGGSLGSASAPAGSRTGSGPVTITTHSTTTSASTTPTPVAPDPAPPPTEAGGGVTTSTTTTPGTAPTPPPGPGGGAR